ncbi:MAG: hypothetical protein K2M11_04600 [Paramuribaculum sp.]|nr:hypothetical protein [Paramuribaculum sp.]
MKTPASPLQSCLLHPADFVSVLRKRIPKSVTRSRHCALLTHDALSITSATAPGDAGCTISVAAHIDGTSTTYRSRKYSGVFAVLDNL